jgi:hypothetical protein
LDILPHDTQLLDKKNDLTTAMIFVDSIWDPFIAYVGLNSRPNLRNPVEGNGWARARVGKEANDVLKKLYVVLHVGDDIDLIEDDA